MSVNIIAFWIMIFFFLRLMPCSLLRGASLTVFSTIQSNILRMRRAGIEPATRPWEGHILPLN